MTTNSQGPDKGPGRPSSIDGFQRGVLVTTLACGLTQRESGVWLGIQQSSVSHLFRKDQEFNQMVKDATDLARMHPYLRLYQAAGKSWKLAARLLEQMERRHGPLTTDELIASLGLMRGLVDLLGRPRNDESVPPVSS